ncbi:MAG: hypothetical protein IJZ75_05325 [Clostridia bacterium]|nr:hypothetical protein [Clostridia bacterium]
MQIIGIDLGTTSICGVVVDSKTGVVLKSKTVSSEAFIDSPNAFEKIQSPEKIISLATEILDGFITEETAAIGVTGQMHGIVYTDIHGNAVSPLYTWQDKRGNELYQDTTYAKYLGSNTGYGNVTDFYNKVNGIRPESAVGYSTIHDYLVMKLCGLKKAKIHISDAASFGLFNLEGKAFDYDCDLDVVDNYTVAGVYKNIPVSVAIGDNQASVFSTLAGDDAVLLNVGTGSQVSAINDKIIVSENLETRPYFDGKYLIVGAALCGGRAFAVLKDLYKALLNTVCKTDDGKVYKIMDEMLEKTTSSPLKVDTRFSGTRANEGILGSITGISADNLTPENLTFGVIEGMVDELYGLYKEMNINKKLLFGSGNGLRKNKPFIKLSEDKFGAELKIPAHKEEAAFGAALFGAIAAGVFKDSKEAQELIRYE